MNHRPLQPSAEFVYPPNGPYSHGVEVGADPNLRWAYVSGQMGIAPDGAIPADVGAQTEIVWTNCLRILEQAGMDVHDVVRLGHYVVGAENLAAYNAARAKFMDGARPASTLLIVAGLARPELRVEVDMVAARPGSVIP